MKTHIVKLKKLGACSEAVEWAKQFKDIQETWDNCKRGDWMLWLMGKQAGSPRSKSRKKLVLAACECARLSLPYVEKGEKRPLKAIETAEKWANGKATLQQVRSATDAAYDAAYDAYADAYDAYADAYDAAYADAYAVADAAADAAAAAAADAAAAAARKEILLKYAQIVRKHYPKVKI